jgi:hypothetical protein
MGSDRNGMANSPSIRICLVSICTRDAIEWQSNPRKSKHIYFLLGSILAHIVTHERLTWYQDAEVAGEQRTPMFLRTLYAWEETWKRHPQTNPNPYNDTHGPLMADAIPLLNTAYFHVYIPRLLQRIKQHLTTTAQTPELTREEFYAILMPHSEIERYNLFRATTDAAHSLLIRARVGLNLVVRTSHGLSLWIHWLRFR